VGGEATEAAEAGAIIGRLGQAHIRQIMPDRQQQGAEERQRRPAEFILSRRRAMPISTAGMR
jgi:hypothetical protein